MLCSAYVHTESDSNIFCPPSVEVFVYEHYIRTHTHICNQEQFFVDDITRIEPCNVYESVCNVCDDIAFVRSLLSTLYLVSIVMAKNVCLMFDQRLRTEKRIA